MEWRKYTDLQRHDQLRNEGREILGEHVVYTVKRDGENVSPYLDEELEAHVASRNHMTNVDSSIVNRMKATPEWLKVVDLLKTEREDYNSHYIPYGELLKNTSPTRIEPRRKHIHWIMFDIWDIKEERYLPYNRVFQLGKKYKIPVVPIVDEHQPMSMTELRDKITELKTWCKRHRREGVVGKVHNSKDGEQLFFKEKIDLPKRKKLDRQNQNQSHLPAMPEEKIIRALQHAYNELGADNWKVIKIAMPVVARHISTEAREYNYNIPQNMFNYYRNTPLETIKAAVG